MRHGEYCTKMNFNTFIQILREEVNSDEISHAFVKNIKNKDLSFAEWFRLYSSWNEFNTEVDNKFYPEKGNHV